MYSLNSSSLILSSGIVRLRRKNFRKTIKSVKHTGVCRPPCTILTDHSSLSISPLFDSLGAWLTRGPYSKLRDTNGMRDDKLKASIALDEGCNSHWKIGRCWSNFVHEICTACQLHKYAFIDVIFPI